jgi:EpsD family peptidyl-prolyl cis-trans isomerase
MIRERMTTTRFLLLVTLLALVLTACGRKEDTKVATQVAARVNSAEITVHQINHALSRSRGVTAENAAQAKREILDALINQELAKRQAILKGLDRSPDVVLDIETARSEILARAYRESLVDYLRKPTPYEVETFYRKHPELFAQRRIFALEELNFDSNNDVAAAVREQISKSRSLKEIAGWLQSRGIAFTANRSLRAAEEIPLEILPKVQLMKERETQLFQAGGTRFRLIRVVAFQAAPVDEVAAAPRIRQFLFYRSSAKVIAKEMNEARKFAKIEYLGEFAKPAAGGGAEVGAESQGAQTLEQLPKDQPKN